VRVGFVASDNYYSRTAWSGSLYSMHQALMATELEVVDLGDPIPPGGWKHQMRRAKHLIARGLGQGQRWPKPGSLEDQIRCRAFATRVAQQLRRRPCDALFVAMIDSELNFLPADINVPIVKMSDATFPLLSEGYDINLDSEQRSWVVHHEATAISKACKIVYSSEWAAASAIQDYNADPGKVVVVPFGANIDDVPPIAEVLAPRPSPPCRLLFVGRDWGRKGGDIAVAVLEALLRRGIEAELTVIGSVPPGGTTHPKLTVIPYLNKDMPEDRRQIRHLFLNSHFLVLPTRADCSPIVICEACALGLPVLATDVGGIPSLIRSGSNGFMSPLSASADAYAECIERVITDPARFAGLVRSAREEYDRRLNWKTWAESVSSVILGVADARRNGPQRMVHRSELMSGDATPILASRAAGARLPGDH
jgi:glycosyltransferase involved in cell wall biosynthesis